ncbi:MAG: hypothetical protein Q9160_007888 [Pyrenula sp. 1 TL-2023]
MQLSNLFLFAGVSLSVVHAQIWNYVIDSSCDTNNFPKAQNAAKEAIDMAKAAVARLNDQNDQVTERLFQTIFKKSRAQESGPKNVLGAIAGFLKTSVPPSRATSAIRIFCDSDDRWQTQTDAATGKKMLFDPHSGIARDASRTPTCKKGGTQLGATYSSIDPVKKSSITLCNRLLQRPYATVDELRQKGITNFASPQGKSIDDYGFISRTVLHEFTHAWPNRLRDDKNNGGAYRWKNIVAKPAAGAKMNSDSHAFFGQISFLTGHKISDDQTERQAGKVVASTSLAKRTTPAKCRSSTARRSDEDCVSTE